MAERLRARELAFWIGEMSTSPRHNATIEIFEPGPDADGAGRFAYDDFLALVEDRLPFVPRYRQRVMSVPGHLANPVWVDDPHLDLGYHVRRSALPRPGTTAQLRELVARIVSRPLDRQRPLWEIYVVEGLEGGRVALLHKTHQALVDGVDTVDLGQVLLDGAPGRLESAPEVVTYLDGSVPDWRPRPRPTPAALALEAVRDTVAHPTTATATARTVVGAVGRRAVEVRATTARVVGGLAGRPAPGTTPFAGPLSQQRRVVTAVSDLAAYRTVRDAHGGTINDVVLATLAGGLRAWLTTRGESMAGVRQVRALVPVSVLDPDLPPTSLGSPVAAHLVDLPVGEPSPVVRLHQVSYSFAAHQATGRAVGAERLAGIAGFAPTTFHAVGNRVAAAEQAGFDLVVTNVPGPQTPLFAAGSRMVASYPVPPLLPGQTLAVGVTSYDGKVFWGVTADRDLVPDADVLGSCLGEALDELLDTVGSRRRVLPRGRRGPRGPKQPQA